MYIMCFSLKKSITVEKGHIAHQFINNIIIIELVLLILLTIILFYILKKHGTKKYLLIEV